MRATSEPPSHRRCLWVQTETRREGLSATASGFLGTSTGHTYSSRDFPPSGASLQTPVRPKDGEAILTVETRGSVGDRLPPSSRDTLTGPVLTGPDPVLVPTWTRVLHIPTHLGRCRP